MASFGSVTRASMGVKKIPAPMPNPLLRIPAKKATIIKTKEGIVLK
jgi:hypothetical protein